MLFSLLGTVFSSILSGGATGIFGVIAQRFADYQNKKLDLAKAAQDQAFELEKRKIDIQISAQEWAGRTKVAEVEGATASDVAASNAFAASLLKEPERYSDAGKTTPGQNWVLVLLDVLRGSVRPLLTVYLCILTTLVYYEAKKLVNSQHMTEAQALELMQTIVGSILYLTTTCVLWWFGTRNKSGPKE